MKRMPRQWPYERRTTPNDRTERKCRVKNDREYGLGLTVAEAQEQEFRSNLLQVLSEIRDAHHVLCDEVREFKRAHYLLVGVSAKKSR
jgi:hypothetical protein